ncbi:MAG: helix-turn-helix domain-containing protein, partial [Ilumatobacteraceae bacterium]
MSRRDSAGTVLREWRVHRRFSQMDLALLADVSAKHLSYVETGRSRPSPEMILHLCEHLEVPLRDRNAILLAAGHAPRYQHSLYEAADSSEVRQVVDMVLSAHRYPAVVVDSRWNLVSANTAASMFLDDVASDLLVAPINVIRLSLHPTGLAPRVANFAEYAGHVLARLRRLVTHDPDPVLVELLAEFAHLDVGPAPASDGVVLPLELRVGDDIARMFSTITTFGTPREVTLSELAIE